MNTTGPLSFLQDIDSGIIGFGFGIPILLAFILINSRRLHWGNTLIIAIVIYVVSLFTGIGLDGAMGISDRMSAIVAGFFAPFIYSTIVTILIFIYVNKGEEKKDLFDHLIDRNK